MIAVEDAELEPVLAFFRRQKKTVITFLGYSDAGYEHSEDVLRVLKARLDRLDPCMVIINSGATTSGIGIVYEMAKQRGFVTTGILSMLAKRVGTELSRHVDYAFYMRDSGWGGFRGDDGKLSPTSSAMVEVSDKLVAIGGGEVARDEAIAAMRSGKPVEFVPAEQHHARAIAEAAKAGEPRPTSFLGEAHEAIKQAFDCCHDASDQAG